MLTDLRGLAAATRTPLGKKILAAFLTGDTDALGAAIFEQVGDAVTPFFERIRSTLLRSIMEDPPAQFFISLRSRGLEVSSQDAALIWAAVIESTADVRRPI